MVDAFDNIQQPPRTRIAAANSATLFVAAKFEEFVREMAREYAKFIVGKAQSIDQLPAKLISTAWRRNMEGLLRIPEERGPNTTNIPDFLKLARNRFDDIFNFCQGDLTKDIFKELIHNENNMRANELNGLFKLSGLSDVCLQMCDKQPFLEAVNETEVGKAHGKLLIFLNDFFERRNSIAHSLNPGNSISPDEIKRDISVFIGISRALCSTLKSLAQTG